MKTYSRKQPSPRYQRLVELYRGMHTEGERFLGLSPEHTFPGKSLPPQAHHIRRLLAETGAQGLLDYGSGKGQQYRYWPYRDAEGNNHPNVQAYWGVPVHCYDPAYTPCSTLPEGRFDGVICTDVLEHVPEEDVPWVVDELFGYAHLFVFANVACFPAGKRLPNGQNAHCTVKPVKWWCREFERAAARHPGVRYEVRLAVPAPAGGLAEEVVTGGTTVQKAKA
jgi:hypothetical protein